MGAVGRGPRCAGGREGVVPTALAGPRASHGPTRSGQDEGTAERLRATALDVPRSVHGEGDVRRLRTLREG